MLSYKLSAFLYSQPMQELPAFSTPLIAPISPLVSLDGWEAQQFLWKRAVGADPFLLLDITSV